MQATPGQVLRIAAPVLAASFVVAWLASLATTGDAIATYGGDEAVLEPAEGAAAPSIVAHAHGAAGPSCHWPKWSAPSSVT